MDDTISRQAAIDAVVSICDSCDSSYCGDCRVNFPGVKDARKALEDLPSAQPEPCEDAVSRADVEGEIANILRGVFVEYQDIAKKTASKLPPVAPKRKTGKWIYNSPVTMKCDQCGFVIKDWDWHRFKFCPNCDCDMRGEQE